MVAMWLPCGFYVVTMWLLFGCYVVAVRLSCRVHRSIRSYNSWEPPLNPGTHELLLCHVKSPQGAPCSHILIFVTIWFTMQFAQFQKCLKPHWNSNETPVWQCVGSNVLHHAGPPVQETHTRWQSFCPKPQGSTEVYWPGHLLSRVRRKVPNLCQCR